MRIFTYIICILSTALTGCHRLAHNEHIDGPYYLSAIDIGEQMSVYYNQENGVGEGRINQTVFAVGWNTEYVVAKRHPDGNRSITEFYYIIRSLDKMYATVSDCVRGPFSRNEFEIKKSQLMLPEFSREIEYLK